MMSRLTPSSRAKPLRSKSCAQVGQARGGARKRTIGTCAASVRNSASTELHATPATPSSRPSTNHSDRPMFSAANSVWMASTVSERWMPRSQPSSTKFASPKGEAQMRMNRYSRAGAATSAPGSISARPASISGHCSATIKDSAERRQHQGAGEDGHSFARLLGAKSLRGEAGRAGAQEVEDDEDDVEDDRADRDAADQRRDAELADRPPCR